MKGELLAESTAIPAGPQNPRFPLSYADATDRLRDQINVTRELIRDIPQNQILRDTYVLTLKLAPGFRAPSHFPTKFILDTQTQEIGSKAWRTTDADGHEAIGKTLFLRTRDADLRRMLLLLERPETGRGRAAAEWVSDVRKVEELSVPPAAERLAGIVQAWDGGRVEVVVHPFGPARLRAVALIRNYLESQGVDLRSMKEFPSPSGLTYLSLRMLRDEIELLGGLNPVRIAFPQPLMASPDLNLRLAPVASGPTPPDPESLPTTVIGMFDGGVDLANPYLSPYVASEEPSPLPAQPDLIEHGTAVAGVLLYGPLNTAAAQLPPPDVQVKSFRVLPSLDGTGVDLHDVVDAIETSTLANSHIDLYNISLGPIGPIEDFVISRFTEVIDRLAFDDGKLFIVAAGNDGEQAGPLARIQAPSDGINNLGVGAYSWDPATHSVMRAPYSCVGPGRQGSNIKPDLVDFGGSITSPFLVIGTTPGTTRAGRGTSLAAPALANKLGSLLARAPSLSPLVIKAAAIHWAEHPDGDADFELGWGSLPSDIDAMLHCGSAEVTCVSTGVAPTPSKFKLPIPVASLAGFDGVANLRWTIVLQVPPDPLRPDDYATRRAQVGFHPHSGRYQFRKTLPSGKRQQRIVDVIADPGTASSLLAQGFTQPDLPMTSSVHPLQSRAMRDSVDLTWDTAIRREIGIPTHQLFEPFLTLRAFSRGSQSAPLRYAVLTTIAVPGYPGDLYGATTSMARFNVLTPLQVQVPARVQIQI